VAPALKAGATCFFTLAGVGSQPVTQLADVHTSEVDVTDPAARRHRGGLTRLGPPGRPTLR
ncbi:MAG: hypothetical protein MUQ56_02635, partial [Thermoleophilia bacterium]|nr:hypothetical protein [Thermoleophilia bacterium]